MNCRYDEIGRWYEVGYGDDSGENNSVWYPSVTTMLANTKDDTYLAAWKERIGEEQAKIELNMAGTFGTRYHEMCEVYGKTKQVIHQPDWFTKRLFQQAKPLIDQHVEKFIHTEITMWSDVLKLAGTADAICMVDGVLTVLDYKTSKRLKSEEWLEDYYLQLACYAWMYKEMVGELPKKGCIIFAHKIDLAGAVFFIKPEDYFGKLQERIILFRRKLADLGY